MKVFLVVLSLVAQSAFADWTALSENDFLMAHPPASGSAEEKREFDDLLNAQARRSRHDCFVGNLQTIPSYTALFGPTVGILSQAEFEASHSVISKSIKLAQKIADAFKQKYRRLRPYQSLKSLEPCLIKPGRDDSYPSSHSASGTIGACLLAKKYPEKAADLLDQGRRVGALRFIGGVHHPSDVASGEDLAQQLCDRLMADPQFVKELGIASH